MRWPIPLAAALALAPLAAPLGAQDSVAVAPSRTAAIVGAVRSSAGAPVPLAEVRLVGTPVSLRTDSSGAFRLTGLPAGRHLVQVRRLGFEPVVLSATLAAAERREVRVELAPLPQRLSAVNVRARSGYTAMHDLRLLDFRRRRGMSAGVFLTRDDLAHARFRDASLVSDVVRSQRTRAGGCTGGVAGQRTAPWLSQTVGCPTQVVVDGLLLPNDPTLRDIDYGDLPLRDVEAIEIYRADRVPPSLQLAGQEAPTRVPLASRRARQWSGAEARDDQGLYVVVWTGRSM